MSDFEAARRSMVDSQLRPNQVVDVRVAEAMAAGVPVVTSNRCGMPYMVEEAKTGYLIDPEDPAAIAAGLEKVVGDESAGREMGTCAKRVAADRFHPDRVAERTLRVYEEALAERRP